MEPVPLKYFGREVGSAVLNEDGTITADFDTSKLTEAERDRLFGNFYTSLSFSIEDPETKLRELRPLYEPLPPLTDRRFRDG